MSTGRLRTGELVAAAGTIGLFVLLFFDWFALDAELSFLLMRRHPSWHTSGWATLGWFMDVLLVLAMLAGAALVWFTASGRALAPAIGSAVLTAVLGGLAALALVVTVLIQPGLGVQAPNALVDVRLPAVLGCLFAASIAAGGWIAMADERTDAPESAYTPPPARPAPPPAP